MEKNQLDFIAHLQASGRTIEELVDLLADQEGHPVLGGIRSNEDCDEYSMSKKQWRAAIAAFINHRVGLLRVERAKLDRWNESTETTTKRNENENEKSRD